jgi:hypothetical protein
MRRSGAQTGGETQAKVAVNNVEGLNRSGMGEIKGKINELVGEIAKIDVLPRDYSIKRDISRRTRFPGRVRSMG